ncbi:MAG: restriction endonuclease subunit S [Chloroflexota bacterium]|nr:restriction endonuclease subunit S [Chloroflexota bacterium]
MAVRGKLVEQSPHDDPAPQLRPNIPYAKLGYAGFPANWHQTTVGTVLKFQYGKGLNASHRTTEGPVPVYGSNGIVGYTDKPLTTRPSIIVGRKGSAGALNLCEGPSWTTDVAYFVEAPPFLALRFLYHSLAALRLDNLGKGVKPGLSRSDAYEQIICVPPLAEQHRIVAKVEELMTLCDRVEAMRTDRETTRNRLAAASLTRLDAPDTDTATFKNHATFALENLTPLTARPDQIQALRQTILNLAVRGKLVAQDPNDEPASELMKRIAANRESLGTTGSIKKPKPLPPIDTIHIPFDLPSGWAWVRFPEVGIFGRGKSRHRPRNDPILYNKGKYPFIQTGDVARSQGSIKTYSSLYNDAGLAQSAMWPAGTLCITIAANIADSGILGFDACFPDSVVGLIVHDSFKSARFFEYFIRTAKDDLQEFAPSTAQKNINLGILTEILIPLPPLGELHRIVTKVDGLMTLCDRLEESLAAGSDTRRRLLDSVLHGALTPSADLKSLKRQHGDYCGDAR